MIYDRLIHGRLIAWWDVWLTGVAKDISFLLTLGAWAFLGYFLISLLSERAARICCTVAALIICLVHMMLLQYFLSTLTMLGADLWYYSGKDIWQSVSATNIRLSAILGLVMLIAITAWCLAKIPGRIKLTPTFGMALVILFSISESFDLAARAQTWRNDSSEYGNSFSNNTSYYFYKQSLDYFFPPPTEVNLHNVYYLADGNRDPLSANIDRPVYTDENRYPFLHKDETRDVLSPFFDTCAVKPNIVVVLVEGLGRAYANDGAYLGSFTPFLDSLSQHSLYWKNFLSQAGRTFAVLPSVLASLPFGKTGFTELGTRMPEHLSLLSLLKHNGYETAFYYGGDAQFDNMKDFLQRNAIDHIYDVQSFPPSYSKLPVNALGFCWGYGDKELFSYYFSTLDSNAAPYCRVLLTVTSHDPFLIHQPEAYQAKFEQRMEQLGFDEERKETARAYEKQYASILYMDDALQQFFRAYAQRPDFNNTIFIITGDHRMPEIPLIGKLDRYHVPMLIYSPLLKRSARFNAISTHFDITPSLLRMLQQQYQLEIPALATWIGTGLDTGYQFGNRHAYPFMQSKNFMIDFIQGEHMVIGSDLYHINSSMRLEPVEDKYRLTVLRKHFEDFRKKNRAIIAGAPLLPDSILQRYQPK
jgi:uncharacterized sulfatase